MTALGLDQALNSIFFSSQISQIVLEKPRPFHPLFPLFFFTLNFIFTHFISDIVQAGLRTVVLVEGKKTHFACLL